MIVYVDKPDVEETKGGLRATDKGSSDPVNSIPCSSRGKEFRSLVSCRFDVRAGFAAGQTSLSVISSC